ncbi:MAG: hypothetical protein Kow0029_20360 [Candidatus Rifleibacteriota bacterium]
MDSLYLDCYLGLQKQALKQTMAMNSYLVSKFASIIDFADKIEPHITIFMGLFPIDQKPLIYDKIREINCEIKGIDVQLVKVRGTGEGYIFWDADNDNSLRHLHLRLLTELNLLRRGRIREKFLSGIAGFSSAEQKNIRKYGFPWVEKLFQPHITLGKIDSESVSLAVKELEREFSCSLKFTAWPVKIGLVGENGVVTPLL